MGYDVLAMPARFWIKVEPGRRDDECWPWSGSRNALGYGGFQTGGRGSLAKAHRVAYELSVGPIPEGHELDHLCRNPSCVNPAHLEPVTHTENVRRGKGGEVNAARQLAKTHCKNGHPFDEANTRLTPRQRVCRACHREQEARRRDRRRNARL